VKYLPFIIVLLLAGCKDRGVEPPPPPPKPIVTLTVNDVQVTDVFFTLKTQNVTLPDTVIIKRNSTTIATLRLTTNDTLLVDTTALPAQTYTYKAIVQGNSSSPLQVTMMDTTSHNFTWQTFTIGGQGGTGNSVVYDVAIVNDTLVYAVGDFYLKDTSGNVATYNAVKWDGTKWNLLPILVRDWGGNEFLGPLYTVFAFGANDVWFAGDADLIQWDGSTYNHKAFFALQVPFIGQVRKMWGTSANNIYCVGLSGAIYNYNGTTWTQLETGTTLDFWDIWGVKQANGNGYEIIAVGNNYAQNADRIILQLNGTSVQKLNDAPLQEPIDGIWFSPKRQYYVEGSGIYQKRMLGDSAWRNGPLQYTTFYTRGVKGTDINNVLVVGDFGELLHYNGISWHSYRTEISPQASYYERIDIRNKFAVAVGAVGQAVLITMGHQQ
jgi:hypothetical protein